MLVLSVVSSRFPHMSSLISGGYSDGAPPLPIPNREVKSVRADGTASSGRVGIRRFFPEESGIPHNVECRISDLYNLHEGCFVTIRTKPYCINKESRELIRETLYNNKEASILFLQMECLHEDFVVHT